MSRSRSDVDRFERWSGTYERHYLQRLVFEPVQEAVLDLAAAEMPKPIAILDVGCGTGRLLRSAERRFPGATLEGVDAARGMIKQAQAVLPAGSRIRFQVAPAEKLPFANGQFDLAFSTMTFHHWDDQRGAVAEVARVLKPGGRWLLADFVVDGFMRYVRRALRLRQFPERAQLEAMLRPYGLAVLAERKVRGLRGQVPVLAIGRSAQAM
ncbi:MAG TPA: methyltransferase domain-containing protein [Candidatus Dormibacteraeota bacterium]|nr:methyltransferase domain-containing protein [Candidatus Dormibacteraeota bacterium]